MAHREIAGALGDDDGPVEGFGQADEEPALANGHDYDDGELSPGDSDDEGVQGEPRDPQVGFAQSFFSAK
jgi:hypothetical protein